MKSCKNCGLEIEDDDKFCKNCGSEIIDDNSEESNQTKFCANCGFEMDKSNKFCPSCGKPTTPNAQNNSSNVVVKTEKSPILAAILSFLIVGVGQIYLGLTKKGIILFFAAMVSGVLTLLLIGWILWLIVWLYSIYDAYNSANKINAGISVEDTIDFNNL